VQEQRTAEACVAAMCASALSFFAIGFIVLAGVCFHKFVLVVNETPAFGQSEPHAGSFLLRHSNFL
jgi:hypothetical protein